MAKISGNNVSLVRVTTDDREQQLWLAAVKREHAVDSVLDIIPEGWSAVLFDVQLTQGDIDTLKMRPGEVRQLRG